VESKRVSTRHKARMDPSFCGAAAAAGNGETDEGSLITVGIKRPIGAGRTACSFFIVAEDARSCWTERLYPNGRILHPTFARFAVQRAPVRSCGGVNLGVTSFRFDQS
jgi:hypothetical protein